MRAVVVRQLCLRMYSCRGVSLSVFRRVETEEKQEIAISTTAVEHVSRSMTVACVTVVSVTTRSVGLTSSTQTGTRRMLGVRHVVVTDVVRVFVSVTEIFFPRVEVVVGHPAVTG